MTAHISTIVDLIHPTASGLGVITTDRIWALFDREIDESTVSEGNFFVAGPDFDTWSGPDLALYVDAESLGDEDEVLRSAGYHGLVEGTISFERINLTDLTTISGLDIVGSGLLYRSKAIFTPTNRLQATTEYQVYISGDEDETDLLQTGISARTVFDTITDAGNTGTGSVTFSGGYVGLAATDTYYVEISLAGAVGTSKFTFYRSTDPTNIFGPFKTKQSGVLLSDGVIATFTEGNYVVGDTWSVVVKARDIFLGNLNWPFKTGSGSIEILPDTVSTSVIGDPLPADALPTTTSDTFEVIETSPEDEATNQSLSSTTDFTITVDFDSNIDPLTVVSGVDISIFTESVTGDTDIAASGNLYWIAHSISDSQLTITLKAGQLLNNNLVTVTLDDTIANTDGVTLDEDYSFWFTTTYDPMYCTLRRIRLAIGTYITEIADDTINLAILVASQEADLLTWNKDNLDDDYYQFARSQWTCCRAQQILLTNVTGASGSLKSKRLGDLEVQYDTSGGNISLPLQAAIDCMGKWEGALLAGGRQVMGAKMVVKGENDPDRPSIGRNWESNSSIWCPQIPAINRKVSYTNLRRTRGWWRR